MSRPVSISSLYNVVKLTVRCQPIIWLLNIINLISVIIYCITVHGAPQGPIKFCW